MSPSRNIPILMVSSALLLGTLYAGDAPVVGPPAQAEAGPADEPQEFIVDEDTARDIGYWRQRLADSPGDVTIRLALGNAYAMNLQFRSAVQEFRTVLKDYPVYKSAWNNLGSAYRAMGQKSQALDAYQKAIGIDPQYALAYYNIGVIHDSSGHYQKALEYYGTAVKLDPKLLDPRKNPQVVKNGRVFAVLLHNYVNSSDHLALPLEPAFPPPEH